MNESDMFNGDIKINYYGALCTMMYEELHRDTPQDELEFYLSYAKKEVNILEALCGSGRFFIPFLKRGLNIKGIDNSHEMLEKLKLKSPNADTFEVDIEQYQSSEKFDYIFISSGSVSLFTDIRQCKKILKKINLLLKTNGKFVFAVDTVASRCKNDNDYNIKVSLKLKHDYILILKSKNWYDEKTHTQFSPSIYELYDGKKLLQSEFMNFQIHLYELGEMDNLLQETGFTKFCVYSSFNKEIAVDNKAEMFLYECSH